MFVKCILYTDKICEDDVCLEAELLSLASNYDFAPKIYNTICDHDCGRIVMEKIEGDDLSVKYGTDEDNIPEDIWDQIRDILWTLYEDESIEYIDIAARNFIEKEGKVYIIDFEHAYYANKEDNEYKINWFLEDFLDGINMWNPDFE